jgi:hypothetical protein
MARAEELAQSLVDYDLQLAEKILRAVAEDLGGPADADLRRLQTFFAVPSVAEEEPRRATGIWKIDFARFERLRELGLALSQLVRVR